MTIITVLLITKGKVEKSPEKTGTILITKNNKLPIINGFLLKSLVCVMSPIDETKGAKGTIPNGEHAKVSAPELIKLRRYIAGVAGESGWNKSVPFIAPNVLDVFNSEAIIQVATIP